MRFFALVMVGLLLMCQSASATPPPPILPNTPAGPDASGSLSVRANNQFACDLLTLEHLGMNKAFEPFGANFYGIHRPSRPEENLYISRVLHKAFIEVNEKGSEAAAATAVMQMLAGAAPPLGPRMEPFIPEFRADRPFLFLVRETGSGAVLFVGRVTLPDA